MRTRGWVVKHTADGRKGYWKTTDQSPTNRGTRKQARVFLTRACAFAALQALRDELGNSVTCCKVFRLTSRPGKRLTSRRRKP